MTRKTPTANFGSLKVKTPLALPRQRIGIMGGTFNPPHDGHRIVAEAALKAMRLDRLWWVVTPGNPLKSHGELAPQTDRMAACRKLARNPRMVVTGFETALGTPYTAATLAFLKRRHSKTEFYWIMGADNLAHFDRWQHWRDIAQHVPIVVVDRPGWRFKALSGVAGKTLSAPGHRPGFTFLTTRLSPLSSTALRTTGRRA